MILAFEAGSQAADLGVLRERALELTNQSRAEADLPPLRFTQPLNEAAQAHAEDMLARSYYSHRSPEGEAVADRYKEHGGSRFHLVLENIARCTDCPVPPSVQRVESFHQGWMDSPGHRENILRRGVEGFGFGIAAGEDTVYAVQTFAGTGASPGLSPGEDDVALSAEEWRAGMVEAINQAREDAGLSPLQHAPALSQAAEDLLASGSEGEDLGLPQASSPYEELPEEERADWRALSMISAACGGCGTERTEGDIRYFAGEWLDDPQFSETLLDPSFTHLGAALRASGDGNKGAVLVVGQTRD